MCNTAVERAALDSGSGQFVAAYLERVTAAMRHALAKAQRAGALFAEADLEELASFLMMALIGVATCVRAKAPGP